MTMIRNALMASAALLLIGCATPSAPDLRGRWKPLNQFAETPQAIPLQQGYVFQASPVDGTLKGMLSRWAKDSRLSLSYLHPNDYTLHAPVAHIRAHSIQTAAAELTSAYAAEGVRVSVEGSQIVVRPAQSGAGGASAPTSIAD
jgi:type IV pilus biogenesis protein CpaD/CtpE